MPPKKAPIRKQVGKVGTLTLHPEAVANYFLASYDDEPAAKKPRTAPGNECKYSPALSNI